MNEKKLEAIKYTTETEGWKHIEEFILWELAKAKEELTKPKMTNPYDFEHQIYYDIGKFLGIKSLKIILFQIKSFLTKQKKEVYTLRLWQGIYQGLQATLKLKQSFKKSANT